MPIHLSPRGQRTQTLEEVLSTRGEVERVGGAVPAWLAGDGERRKSSWYRRAARVFVSTILVDKFELVARRRLGRWQPSVDAAVLIGFPWSPLAPAARKLSAADIPFVVDVGDPWVVTNPSPTGGRLRRWRARRQEEDLWRSAAGAIVTTQGQGDSLRHLFPHLRVLVRPNGYRPVAPPTTTALIPPRNDDELRLVHYGSLYGERVDLSQILRRLVDSGRWSRVTLWQYGPDWERVLAPVADGVVLEHRPPLPWDRVLAEAPAYDAAVVVGWADPAKMPSKAVQYLTLPIPRIAMSNPGGGDALAAYVVNQPGWAVVDAESEDPAALVAAHLARDWSNGALAPPEGESWPRVADSLAEFVVEVTSQ